MRGWQHLAGLTRLQALWLDNTKVTDAGLTQLAGLTRLQLLNAPRHADYGCWREEAPAGIAELQDDSMT